MFHSFHRLGKSSAICLQICSLPPSLSSLSVFSSLSCEVNVSVCDVVPEVF